MSDFEKLHSSGVLWMSIVWRWDRFLNSRDSDFGVEAQNANRDEHLLRVMYSGTVFMVGANETLEVYIINRWI